MSEAWVDSVLKDIDLDHFFTTDFEEPDGEDEKTEEAKTGRRKQRVKVMVKCKSWPIVMLIFFLRLAPIRFISAWLLSASQMRTPATEARDRAEGKRRYPPPCDVTNSEFSAFVVAQQFFASLLKAGSPLYAAFMHYVVAAGVDTTWAMHNLRRQIGNASAECHRRHCHMTALYTSFGIYFARSVFEVLGN